MQSYRRLARWVMGACALAGLLALVASLTPWGGEGRFSVLGGRATAQLPTDRKPAPALPEGFAWWNTERPLDLAEDLKGRVVVLDFWTYACINCIHNLATLDKVEEHYRDAPVTVVGVHSNKFTNEAEAANIRQAILRYGIRHPVVVDEAMKIWRRFGVRAWPTLVFIDAEGQVVGAISGEQTEETLITIIDQLLAEGKAKGVLATGPLMMRREAMPESTADGLAFPGKIAADAAGERLFIADSNHNRILVAGLEGVVRRVIGSGQAGSRDGPPDVAQFNNPQGMAHDAVHDWLYVADTGNHLVRRVDLTTGEVRTLLGTGGQVFDRSGGGKGTGQGLNSPWDVALHGGFLYIAMAGSHQLWRMDLASGEARAWVGSGAENIVDGTARRAQLAQPSGLAVMGDSLYFMDSEVSALRRAALPGGEVETLIGRGLFEFGDADGSFDRAKLQHPLGVTHDGRRIYVADTYNHKIKAVDPAVGRIETLAGAGQAGAGVAGDGVQLNEPGGLVWAGGRLFVADTNNHRIVTLDPVSGEASVLELRFGPEVTPAGGD